MIRRSDLAIIHIAKKQLGLDDETYRAMLLQHGGVNSSKDLSATGAERVIKHLKASGFKAEPKYGKRPKHRPGCGAMMDKVEALLADRKLPWSYAQVMAKHMFNVEKLEWLEPEDLHKLVAALQIDANRRSGAKK